MFDVLEESIARIVSLDTPAPLPSELQKAIIPHASKVAAAVKKVFADILAAGDV